MTINLHDRWKPSVTVAAIIRRERDGKYLLVEEHTRDGLRLNNPAGHLEPGETPLEGVVREVLEETRRPFVADAFLGLYLARFQRPATDEDVTYLRLAFAGRVGDEDTRLVLDAPIVRTLWMGIDELRQAKDRHRSDLVMQCIDDHHRGVRHPLEAIQSHPSLKAPKRSS